jgi:hypothetical protein
MTHATSKRRGRGEDSIYWDDTKGCYVGAMSLGYSPSGTRIRKRVMARTGAYGRPEPVGQLPGHPR